MPSGNSRVNDVFMPVIELCCFWGGEEGPGELSFPFDIQFRYLQRKQILFIQTKLQFYEILISMKFCLHVNSGGKLWTCIKQQEY